MKKIKCPRCKHSEFIIVEAITEYHRYEYKIREEDNFLSHSEIPKDILTNYTEDECWIECVNCGKQLNTHPDFSDIMENYIAWRKEIWK